MTATDVPSGGHYDTLNAFYAAEQRYVTAGGVEAGADFTELAALFHPEFVCHQGPSLPYSGDWRGAQGLEQFFAVFTATWSSLELSDVRYFSGDTGVAITMRMKATARATGKRLDTTVAHFLIIEDGLIREFNVFYDDPVGLTEITTS
ncbi:nuclear transport factor 2 family protein [Sphaerimonospora sp. CA-214678]|uniref:nuclear transport factor 2 family protein n=1 Tax=Sphaerimonospora sp. CA-214678 TaxID=3240029 RepID=UPI003D90D0C5